MRHIAVVVAQVRHFEDYIREEAIVRSEPVEWRRGAGFAVLGDTRYICATRYEQLMGTLLDDYITVRPGDLSGDALWRFQETVKVARTRVGIG